MRLPAFRSAWPTSKILQVQFDFFKACQIQRLDKRKHYPFGCGACGTRFMTPTGRKHHQRRFCTLEAPKPSNFHTPVVTPKHSDAKQRSGRGASSSRARDVDGTRLHFDSIAEDE